MIEFNLIQWSIINCTNHPWLEDQVATLEVSQVTRGPKHLMMSLV